MNKREVWNLIEHGYPEFAADLKRLHEAFGKMELVSLKVNEVSIEVEIQVEDDKRLTAVQYISCGDELRKAEEARIERLNKRR